jgi:hypothetical protein
MWATVPFDVGRDSSENQNADRFTTESRTASRGISGPLAVESPDHFDRNTHRGINALQKARALCLKGEAVTPKAKAIAAKIAKVTKAPAKKTAKRGMSDEGRAKIAAAQQKRWAKVKRAKNKAAKAAKAALVVPAAE